MISLNVIRVFSSPPLATLTMIWPFFTYGAICADVLLVKGDGTASTATSGSLRQLSRSHVISISSGSRTPGSFDSCSLFVFSISTSSLSADHRRTLCPLLRSEERRVGRAWCVRCARHEYSDHA